MDNFSQMDIPLLYSSLHTSSSGLTDKEAEKRLQTYGLNVLAEKDNLKLLKQLFSSFFSPLILLLLGASLISGFLGDVTNFLIILSIVLFSGIMTFYQHFKAENAVEKLKRKTALTTAVLRDGKVRQIPFSHITIGDIILLTRGNLLPADIRFIETKEVTVDESILTGESFPATKQSDAVSSTSKIKAVNMGLSGTHMVSGEAKGIVIAVGKQTQFGLLSKQISMSKPPTEFDRDMSQFSKLIIWLIGILTIFVFLVTAVLHHNPLESLIFAVALAVGLTPELMPVVITISLSHGAQKMEQKEVIVKFLPAIQNFGSMDILCTDKTGTLTEGDIGMADYQNAEGQKTDDLLTVAVVHSFFDSKSSVDTLNKATLAYPHHVDTKKYKKIEDIPFDFERKRSSVVVAFDKKLFLYSRGTPYSILEKCSEYQASGVKKLSVQRKQELLQKFEELSKAGFRVLAVAKKEIGVKKEYKTEDESSLCFLGFLLFADPVKNTVAHTVKELEELGIEMKILTGDNEFVTQYVCQQSGIAVKGILTGEKLNTISNSELPQLVENTTIFARLDPEQKQQVIDILRKNKHTVGYMGDGVNDAPPLKHADVGISVSSGADIARDVSDIVLLRKSLHILKEGVIEGRKTHENIFKYIIMSISSNFGNMVTVAAASVFLPFLPMLSIQILLLDFLYDLTQITIPTDNIDIEFTLKPQKWNMGLIKRAMFVFGPASSLFDFITIFVLLFIFHYSTALFRTGWFVESLLTQTIIIFALRTRRIPFLRSVPSMGIVLSCLIGLLAGVYLPFSPIGHLFAFLPLPLFFFGFVTLVIICYVALVEVLKRFFYSR